MGPVDKIDGSVVKRCGMYRLSYAYRIACASYRFGCRKQEQHDLSRSNTQKELSRYGMILPTYISARKHTLAKHPTAMLLSSQIH